MPLLLAAGCEDSPSVEVQSWVGPRYAKQDEARRAAEAKKVGQTVLAEVLEASGKTADGEEGSEEDHAAGIELTAHPPVTADELEGLVTALRKAPLAEVAGPAHRIAAADPSLWPQLRTLLLAERKAPKGDYRSLLRAIGGDVPNKYGHFNLAWKKAHGFQVKLSQDWFADLLALPRSKVSPMLRKVYRDCVLQTALLRAASRIGAEPAWSADVVATLLDAAYHHQGTFRDEVGRSIRTIGDEAIAHLILRSDPPPGHHREDDVEVQKAEYAEVQLDRMDRLHPQRAIDAVRSDPRRLAAVLAAYGAARVGEAAAPLLDYADAADPTVRATARASLFNYVVGPPPMAARRKIRLLGGETSHARAYLTFRQRAALALSERVYAEAPDLLEPDCGPPDRGEDTRSLRQIEACDRQPLRHALALFDRLDEQRAERRKQRIESAIAMTDVDARVSALDAVLALDPGLPERDQLVAQYRAAGLVALDDKDTAKAAQLLRKSAMLAEPDDRTEAHRLRVTALLAEAATPGLSRQGRAMLLATALELDPDDPALEAAHAQARKADDREVAPPPWKKIGLGFGGGLTALALLGLMVSPLRRRLF